MGLLKYDKVELNVYFIIRKIRLKSHEILHNVHLSSEYRGGKSVFTDLLFYISLSFVL